MATSISAPESPFDPRPSSGSASGSLQDSGRAASPSRSSSDTTESTPLMPNVSSPVASARSSVSFPLTSFESTPHNVACIAFCLGSLWCLGLVLLFNNLHLFNTAKSWIVLNPLASDDQLNLAPKLGIKQAVQSPILGMYLASWAIFHLLEFVVTSMYNPGKLSASSFLLDNGNAYHIAHAVGMLEHVLEEAYFPPHWRKHKQGSGVILLGLSLLVIGQTLRSGAMITASSNFSHIVAYKKLPSHQLVKTGIYAWSRHPSYAGFVWWALGTQIMLGNPISTPIFAAVLYHFFSSRIRVEEKLLIKFFGDDYIQYRKEVPTRILFIR